MAGFLGQGGGGGGGEGNEIVWIIEGGQVHICVQSVRQTRASGGMFPWEILILDLLLDTISWNLGLFSHTHTIIYHLLHH